MSWMNEKCALIKSFPAFAISLCLVWALMGCLTICASHIEEEREDNATHSLGISLTGLEEDCCPIVKASVEIQERNFVNLGSGLGSVSSQLSTIEESSPRIYVFDLVPAHSPPFEQLCILRI